MSVELLAGAKGLSDATTSAVFFSLAKKRKAKSAGSGWFNWGKSTSNINNDNINEGMFTGNRDNPSEYLYIGTTDADKTGRSRTGYPVVEVNGVRISLRAGNTGYANRVFFPGAPDGLDGTDGFRYPDHGAMVTAVGSAMSGIVLSRQDFVMLEVWHEPLTEKDILSPYGCAQYRGAYWNGIGMNDGITSQSYASFGEWDTVNLGKGLRYSTATNEQLQLFLDDPENNIYEEDGILIQTKWRIRVIRGFGNSWDYLGRGSTDKSTYAYIRYRAGEALRVRGMSDDNGDFENSAYNNRALYVSDKFPAGATSNLLTDRGVGIFSIAKYTTNDNYSDYYGHKGRCVAVPLALVQRRNKGAYHEDLNLDGTGGFLRSDNLGWVSIWYANKSKLPLTKSDCFNSDGEWVADRTSPPFINGLQGNISNGVGTWNMSRPDRLFHDQIHSDDILDMRMSCRDVDLEDIRAEYFNKSVKGEIRGWEKNNHMRIKFLPDTVTYSGSLSFSPNNNLALDFGTTASSSRDVDNQVFHSENSTHWLLYGDNGKGMIIKRLNINNPSARFPYSNNRVYLYGAGDRRKEFSEKYPVGTMLWIGQLRDMSSEYSSMSANPYQKDILTTPVDMVAFYPEGRIGNWVPNKPANAGEWSATRKWDEGYNWLSISSPTIIVSEGWSSGLKDDSNSHYTSNNLNRVKNDGEIKFAYYRTQGTFTEEGTNVKPLTLGNVFVSSTAMNESKQGSSLAYSVAGVVVKGSAGNRSMNPTLTSIGIEESVGRLASHASVGLTIHGNVNPSFSNSTPAFKCLDYLADEDSTLTLKFIYKQMRYDVVGDNGANFTDIDGESDPTGAIKGKYWRVTSGRNRGYWKTIRATNTKFNHIVFTKLNNKLVNHYGGVYYEEWDGNGWGDDNIIDGTLTMQMNDDNDYEIVQGLQEFKLPYFHKKK